MGFVGLDSTGADLVCELLCSAPVADMLLIGSEASDIAALDMVGGTK